MINETYFYGFASFYRIYKYNFLYGCSNQSEMFFHDQKIHLHPRQKMKCEH